MFVSNRGLRDIHRTSEAVEMVEEFAVELVFLPQVSTEIGYIDPVHKVIPVTHPDLQ